MVKVIFLVFNAVYLILGLTLLIVGILAKDEFSDVETLSTDMNYNTAAYIMIACGVFVLLIGVVGLWGAVASSGGAMKLYIVVLVVLFLLEIIGAIAAFVLRDKLSKSLKKAFQ